MIVLDASVVVELLLRLPAAERIEKRIVAEEYQIHSPELLYVEVLQVFRRLILNKVVSEERATIARDDLLNLPMEQYPHLPLLARIWELRHNVSAYDATYVALAELLECPLLTLDERLMTAPGIRAEIQVS